MLVKITPVPQNGEGTYILISPRQKVIVDTADYDLLSRYHWRIKKSGCCVYASAKIRINNKIRWIKMHRLIMNTPAELECHHLNHKTLDNRRSNLKNVTRDEHCIIHTYRT